MKAALPEYLSISGLSRLASFEYAPYDFSLSSTIFADSYSLYSIDGAGFLTCCVMFVSDVASTVWMKNKTNFN